MNQDASTDDALLRATALCRQFGAHRAVSDLSLTLFAGDVLGLVGLNGAGKSTTLRMLAGLLAPNSGSVSIAGFDIAEQPNQARRQLGYLPDPPALHNCLRVREAIDLNARLHRLQRSERNSAIERVIDQCQLGAVADKRVGALSKGFRQRTGLALALVHDPRVLILDEPASGLDPAQNEHLNQLISTLAAERAVVFSSHALGDVQSCCTRVALLRDGQLAAVRDSAKQHDKPKGRFKLKLRATIEANALLRLSCVADAESIGDNDWLIELHGDKPDALIAAALANQWGLEALKPQRAPLDEVLMQLRHNRHEEAA